MFCTSWASRWHRDNINTTWRAAEDVTFWLLEAPWDHFFWAIVRPHTVTESMLKVVTVKTVIMPLVFRSEHMAIFLTALKLFCLDLFAASEKKKKKHICLIRLPMWLWSLVAKGRFSSTVFNVCLTVCSSLKSVQDWAKKNEKKICLESVEDGVWGHRSSVNECAQQYLHTEDTFVANQWVCDTGRQKTHLESH